MKATIVRSKSKPVEIKFDNMVGGTLYNYVDGETGAAGVVLCVGTRDKQLIELSGLDIGTRWGPFQIDYRAFTFTPFVDTLKLSN